MYQDDHLTIYILLYPNSIILNNKLSFNSKEKIRTLTNDAGQTIIAFWIVGLQSGPCCYGNIGRIYWEEWWENNIY